MRKAKRIEPYKNPKCKNCTKFWDTITRCDKHLAMYEEWCNNKNK